MSNYVELYDKLSRFPGGVSLFNIGLVRKSPYTSQLKPKVSKLRYGYAEVKVANRKPVHNHLGSIDSNALFTLSQLVMGLCIETVIPKDKRWIPVGAKIEYLKLAKTGVSASCDCSSLDFDQSTLEVPIDVKDENSDMVQQAVVTVHISSKKNTN